jgi:hypothetical protein
MARLRRVDKNRRCASGLRIYVWVAGSRPNLEDGARNLFEDRRQALPGKEKSMYIGIGTIVLIVIIVLVVLMLRRLCYAAAPAILIRRMNKSHDGRG